MVVTATNAVQTVTVELTLIEAQKVRAALESTNAQTAESIELAQKLVAAGV